MTERDRARLAVLLIVAGALLAGLLIGHRAGYRSAIVAVEDSLFAQEFYRRVDSLVVDVVERRVNSLLRR